VDYGKPDNAECSTEEGKEAMAKIKGKDDNNEPNTSVSQPKYKTKCPIGRRQFLDAAQPIVVLIDKVAHSALPLENSTGSFGWNVNGKMLIQVGGINLPVQISCNFTVIGSKEVLE
jgi:hypothetical protein